MGREGRTWEAVADSARGARLPDLASPFFVAPRVRKRWRLTSRDLHRGLDALERDGLIVTVERKRGKWRRVRLGPAALSVPEGEHHA